MKHLKKYKMILFYSVIIGICAIGGFWGTYKLSILLNKDDEIKKQHLIPDILLLDCDITFTLDEENTNLILERVYEKSNLPNGNIKDLEVIPISGFFNQYMNEKHKQYKDNFSLEARLYDNLKDFTIQGTASSKDRNTLISFYQNDNTIVVGTPENKTRDTYIEIISYNKKENSFKGKINNLQLIIESYSKSQYIMDLSDVKYTYISSYMVKYELQNIVLKTFKTKYFRLKDVQLDETGFYCAKLAPTSV